MCTTTLCEAKLTLISSYVAREIVFIGENWVSRDYCFSFFIMEYLTVLTVNIVVVGVFNLII